MTMTWRWFGFAALWLLASCGSGQHAPAPSRGGGSSSQAGARAPAGDAGAPATPRSEPTCRAPVVEWAARCSAQQGLAIASVQCPEERVALVDLRGAPELRVEMRYGSGRGFRQVGQWALSPVGNFADWEQVDPRMREGFDKITACVRASGDFGGGAMRAPQRRAQQPNAPTTGNSVPWLLLGALACALASLWPARRSSRARRRVLLGGALALGVLALRHLLFPGLFFHQNGQGPLWVSVLLSPQHHPYGPGFRAVFGWLRWCTHDPDRALFFVQGVLASLSVPCAAFIARRLGASRWLAFALAFAVAIDPLLGRLSRSESYYGLGASLLFLATALLASSLTSLRVRSAGFVLPVLGAALIIAQHAHVHPVGWVASSLCPAVLLLGPGHWRRRVRRTVVGTLIMAAVLAVAALPTVLAVLRSAFGVQWTEGSQGAARFRLIDATLPYAALIAVAAVAGTRSKLRSVLNVSVMAVALVALVGADVVGSTSPTFSWVHQAYLRLYAPIMVVLAAAMLTGLPRNRQQVRAMAAAVALLALLVSWRAWPSWTKAPTDALEQQALLRWRRELPAGQIMYLERVGQHVLMLPFYRDMAGVGPSPVLLRAGEFAEDFSQRGGPRFYVHTSLCSTSEGRASCERVEQRYQMTRLHEVVLPALPSMTYLSYDAPRVRVALYRVDGRNPNAP
ncbi:MAG: hypothetical protein KA978_29215 [Deltaproteobacteria bacterium]|nr:hypothetical protein [Deltaproteobacteria bacterium]